MSGEQDDNRGEDDEHIVDVLIKERAPGLMQGPLWPIVRPPLNALLKYREAREMADDIAGLDAYEALDHASGLLHLDLSTRARDCVPEEGACLIVVNHPTGIADGIALYDGLKERRPDIAFFANDDALRVCPGLEEAVVPVVWPPEERTMESSKQTLSQAIGMIEDERAIVVFPSGAVARLKDGQLRDEPWEPTAISLAKKYEVDLVPAFLCGPYSRLFNLFDRISEELRDVTLFQELLNKKGKSFQLVFGETIEPEAIREADDEELADRLRQFIEDELGESPGKRFEP